MPAKLRTKTVTEMIHDEQKKQKESKEVKINQKAQKTQEQRKDVDNNQIIQQQIKKYSVGNLVVVMVPEKYVDFDANGNLLYDKLDGGEHYQKIIDFIKKLYEHKFVLKSVVFNPLKHGFYLWFERQNAN